MGVPILSSKFYVFRKMLISAFVLRFKAKYLEKMRGYPNLSLWFPIPLAKIYIFPIVILAWHKTFVFGR